jgi:uncharacterized small protein (DUF1192 family)
MSSTELEAIIEIMKEEIKRLLLDQTHAVSVFVSV